MMLRFFAFSVFPQFSARKRRGTIPALCDLKPHSSGRWNSAEHQPVVCRGKTKAILNTFIITFHFTFCFDHTSHHIEEQPHGDDMISARDAVIETKPKPKRWLHKPSAVTSEVAFSQILYRRDCVACADHQPHGPARGEGPWTRKISGESSWHNRSTRKSWWDCNPGSWQEEITKSRKTSEEQWPDQPIPLEDDAKNDRDVKSRRRQPWKGSTLEYDVNSGSPSDLGANLVLKHADTDDCQAQASSTNQANSNTELSELEEQALQGDRIDGTS